MISKEDIRALYYFLYRWTDVDIKEDITWLMKLSNSKGFVSYFKKYTRFAGDDE